MGDTAGMIREQTTAIVAHARGSKAAIGAVLGLASQIDPADEAAAEALLEAVEVIGRAGQANQGQVTLALAQADRVKAGRGGLVPWVSRHLDATPGAARSMVESARELGRLPELAGPLVSGRLGASTIRALTRTACAVKKIDGNVAQEVAKTLDLAGSEGVSAANEHVRILEKSIEEPVIAEKPASAQRQRSFLRVLAGEGGMRRVEGLLDVEHATVFTAALDQTVAAWLREGRGGHMWSAGEDGDGIEQLQAQALVHLATVSCATDAAQRQASSTSPMLYVAQLEESADIGRDELSYGLFVPEHALDGNRVIPEPSAAFARRDQGFEQRMGEPAGSQLDFGRPMARWISRAPTVPTAPMRHSSRAPIAWPSRIPPSPAPRAWPR